MKKNTSELVIIKNVNINLENQIINLEKLQAKAERYNIIRYFRTKYLMKILKTMLSRLVKIPTL